MSTDIETDAALAAPYPSILRCSGRSIVDANGVVLPRMKGFNVQPVPWPQQAYTDMHAVGATIVRTPVFWDYIEPDQGVIDMNYVAKLDAHIARLRQAGLYTVLSLYYGPQNKHCPLWVGGSQLKNYKAHGQNVTQFLAKRYGTNLAVIGMGINEPTPDSQSSGYLITHLAEQKLMMQWFRPAAPQWIGFISAAYGPSAWLPNVPGSGHSTSSNNQTFTGAPADPFGGMGNWCVEAHCYFETTTDGELHTWDGRNAYGMPNGSYIVKTDTSPYPPTGHTRAKCQASLKAFWAPYVAYCQLANVPLAVMEWGWKSQYSGGELFAADLAAALVAAGASIVSQWDFNTNTGTDGYASRPGGIWQKATTIMMGAV